MFVQHIVKTSTPIAAQQPIVVTPPPSQDGPSDPFVAEISPLKKTYPVGNILNAFVTNVHNVTQLRFFMFVKNAANAQHFANIRNTTTPPAAYDCLRMPGEGVVFGLRMGESTVVRAVRLRTMCITTTCEVFLPDVGRNQVLESRNSDMYHLPLKLRKAPGIAVCCQLRGINDDVTIVPDNMRALLKGLLFRSVKLRVDGYIGAILKVQLLNVTLDDLKVWSTELGKEQNDFVYALHNVSVVPKETKAKEKNKEIVNMKNKGIYTINLDPITETPKRLKDGFESFRRCLPPINELSGSDDHDDEDFDDTDETDDTDNEGDNEDDEAEEEEDENDNDNENNNDNESEEDNDNEANNPNNAIDLAELFELGKTPEEVLPSSPMPSPSSSPSPPSSTLSPTSPIATSSSATSSSASSLYSWFSALNSVYFSVMSLDDDVVASSTSVIQAIEAQEKSSQSNEEGACGVSSTDSTGTETVVPRETTNLNDETFDDTDWLNRPSVSSGATGRAIRGGIVYEFPDIIDRTHMRPLLGRTPSSLRPILGSGNSFSIENKTWKRDFLPALAIIDNRNSHLNCARDDILTITPTYIGQLERFFGVVHHRGECYLQHMWTEDEIPWSSRYTDDRTPYIFDVVLAKHSGDFKWYRAKVVEIIKENKVVRVFFVDYGGEELIQLRNLANLGRTISKLPFQATLFRLHDLIDATTTKNERALGIDILRKALLKETISVRVVKNEYDEITICFDDARFSHLPVTMIRKGFLKRYNSMMW